jgi:hypothetical protein
MITNGQIFKRESRVSLKGRPFSSEGAIPGVNFALTPMAIMNNRAMIIPGIVPAANKAAIDVSAMTPYIINPLLGGISNAKVPPAQTVPSVSLSLYFLFRNSGIATLPTIAALAVLDPNTAANIAESTIFDCNNLPGSLAINGSTLSYIRTLRPLTNMI